MVTAPSTLRGRIPARLKKTSMVLEALLPAVPVISNLYSRWALSMQVMSTEELKENPGGGVMSTVTVPPLLAG